MGVEGSVGTSVVAVSWIVTLAGIIAKHSQRIVLAASTAVVQAPSFPRIGSALSVVITTTWLATALESSV
jgi:hypothetical protein